MTIASAIAKQLRYKIETTYGTPPVASGAQLLRRVESTLSISKDTYQSKEKRTDYQLADMRHGLRKTGGKVQGELSPGTYGDFISAVLRRDFTDAPILSALSITVAGSGPYTLTRSAGSYLTDGVKIGDVVRLTAGAFNAANLNKNIMVTGLTALVLTGIVVNGSTLTAEGPIATASLTVAGKKTYTPQTGHTDRSFCFEHWYADINQSEVFTGCKVGGLDISLPPTGMTELSMQLIGKDIITATSAYYTSPTALTSNGIVAAVNGVLLVGGTQVAIVTGLSFKLNPNNQPMDPVVGSNSIPGIAPGTVEVSGQFTAYFDAGTVRDYFIDEANIALAVVLTTNNDAAADFIAFSAPNVKLTSADKDDAAKGIVGTYGFTALLNSTGGIGTASELTTFVVQDSLA